MDPTPEVEILLVEDNPADVELTLRALTSHHLANQLFVCRDGAEAIDFFFGDAPNALRDIGAVPADEERSEEHTSELQSRLHLVCRLLLEKKKKKRDSQANVRKKV